MPKLLRYSHRSFPKTLFLAGLLAIHSDSFAQEVTKASTETPAPKVIETKDKTLQVEVKANNEIDIAKRDTAAKTVISNEDLMRYGDTNLNDAMKRVPGVLVVKDQLQLPGMNARYTQILIDGEPPRGVTIADLPMSLIERVEIYRTGSAQFSSQAMAGTINIVLKRVPSNKQAQIKVHLSNTYKPSSSVEWLSSDKLGDLSYSLSMSVRDSGGQMSAPFSVKTDVYNATDQVLQSYELKVKRDIQARDVRINPRIQYKTKGGSTITLTSSINFSQNNFTNNDRYDFYFGDTLPVSRFIGKGQNETKAGNTNLRLLSSFGRTKLDINTGLNVRLVSNESSTNTYSKDQRALYQRDVNTQGKNLVFSNSGKITVPSNAEHDIVTGWSYSNADSNNRRRERQFNYADKSTDPSFQTTLAKIDKLAVFAQDEWKYSKLSAAYFGLRWEAIKIQSEGNSQDNLRHQSSVFSPIAQGLWLLNPENTDRLRLGLSRTYQAPADSFLISPINKLANNSLSLPNFRGNPSLRPELAWTLDAAYEHSGKDDWNYNLRAKLRNITDLHQGNISQENGVWWMMYVNAGNAIAKSLEFDTQFPLKRFVEPAPKVDISLDLSKHWSRVSYRADPNDLTDYLKQHDGDRILDPTIFSIKLGLDYKANDLPLSIGSNLRYVKAHSQLTSKTQRTLSSNSHEIDLYSSWKFNKQSQLRFSIDNLLKRRFRNVSEDVTPMLRSLTTLNNPGFRRVALNYEHKF